MAELRRVLIQPQRLAGCGQQLELTSDERHYLEKVLRLRSGSPFAIVDGQGGLHQAELRSNGWAKQGKCLEQQQRQEPELVLLQAFALLSPAVAAQLGLMQAALAIDDEKGAATP